MKRNKYRITLDDYMLANRRASRMEEIEAHGRPVIGRTMIHRSKKTYSRKTFKAARFEE